MYNYDLVGGWASVPKSDPSLWESVLSEVKRKNPGPWAAWKSIQADKLYEQRGGRFLTAIRGGGELKLISVVQASDGKHKYEARFLKDGKEIRTKFGARSMDDYTITHDTAQRSRYRDRHSKDLDTKDITRAGYLSYYLLWGDSTSLDDNIRAYKKKFGV